MNKIKILSIILCMFLVVQSYAIEIVAIDDGSVIFNPDNFVKPILIVLVSTFCSVALIILLIIVWNKVESILKSGFSKTNYYQKVRNSKYAVRTKK